MKDVSKRTATVRKIRKNSEILYSGVSPSDTSPITVLKNKSFLLLWLGQIISNFGDRLNQMALIALVYKKAPGSAVELAKLLFFIVIPVFVIGPIAGVYVDRWDRKRVMIISDILRGILVLSIPFFILFFKNFIVIYILVFLLYAITRFFLPSKMAIIPDIVSKDMLLMANTLSDTTRMVATFVAFGIAGMIVDKIGAVNGFYIDAITYFISALFIYNMVVEKTTSGFKEEILKAKEAIKKAIRKSVWSEIREGIRLMVECKELRFVIKNFFLLMAGIGASSCVIIVFVQEAFGSVTKDLSFLIMLLGFGALVGTMLYGRLGQRLKKEDVILACILSSGLFVVLFAVTARFISHLWISGANIFLLGISIGPIIVSLNTIVHELIPQDIRGRVFSSLEVVIHLAFLIFMFIAAYFAEYFERFWILAFCGFFFLVCGASGIFAKK